MNEIFRRLTPKLKEMLLREMNGADLKAMYALTDDEVILGKAPLFAEDQQAPSENSAYDESKHFAEFLQKEYDNIANAHFNTGTTITRFFQFYLLIVGFPLSVAGVFVKLGIDKINIDELLTSSVGSFTSVLAGIVALIGLCMMAYLVNLRLDGLQYARTVNGVRKFFYSRSRLSIYDELSMRILPRSTTQPRYWEIRYFGWVILTFVLLDMLYFFVFSWQVVMGWIGQTALIGMVSMAGSTVLFGLLHVIVYWHLVRHRELRYLRTHIIGLDIDGVLSDHREAFCRILSSETGKTLDAKTITKIPVRECKELRDMDGQRIVLHWRDEHAVFNKVAYWQGLRRGDEVE